MKKYVVIIVSVLVILGVTLFMAFQNKEKEKTKPVQAEPKEEISDDLFGEYYAKASDKVANMSLEEKVGQLFLVRMNNSKASLYISSYHPGGFVLFGVDFKNLTKEQVINKISNYQSMSSIPLIIAVDEEGGSVVRISSQPSLRSTKFPSSQNLYKSGGFPLIESTEKEKVSLLKYLGINLNLAPVADVTTNHNAYMYNRSFGQDANLTSEFVKKVVTINVQDKLGCSLKHFPGYGNNLDTHIGLSIDNRSYETFVNNDYLPFKAGIESKVPTILVSHNIIKALDDSLPASLSYNVHQELITKLNFTGLIITDDLSMDAISKYVANEKRAILAFTSGNDLIITSDINMDYTNLLNAFKNNELSIEELDYRVKKILAFKYAYNIIKEV